MILSYYIPRSDKINLAYVGEISERKNQIFLVRAMKHLEGYTLTLVGDGDERQRIESYIRKNNLLRHLFYNRREFVYK